MKGHSTIYTPPGKPAPLIEIVQREDNGQVATLWTMQAPVNREDLIAKAKELGVTEFDTRRTDDMRLQAYTEPDGATPRGFADVVASCEASVDSLMRHAKEAGIELGPGHTTSRLRADLLKGANAIELGPGQRVDLPVAAIECKPVPPSGPTRQVIVEGFDAFDRPVSEVLTIHGNPTPEPSQIEQAFKGTDTGAWTMAEQDAYEAGAKAERQRFLAFLNDEIGIPFDPETGGGGKGVGDSVTEDPAPTFTPHLPTFDHDEVRCEAMAEADDLVVGPGGRRSCCICDGHECQDSAETPGRDRPSIAGDSSYPDTPHSLGKLSGQGGDK